MGEGGGRGEEDKGGREDGGVVSVYMCAFRLLWEVPFMTARICEGARWRVYSARARDRKRPLIDSARRESAARKCFPLLAPPHTSPVSRPIQSPCLGCITHTPLLSLLPGLLPSVYPPKMQASIQPLFSHTPPAAFHRSLSHLKRPSPLDPRSSPHTRFHTVPCVRTTNLILSLSLSLADSSTLSPSDTPPSASLSSAPYCSKRLASPTTRLHQTYPLHTLDR